MGETKFRANLAEKLKESLKESGLTLTEVAEHVGVSRQSVSKWANNNGSGGMTIDNFISLSGLIDLDLYAVLGIDKPDAIKHEDERINRVVSMFSELPEDRKEHIFNALLDSYISTRK